MRADLALRQVGESYKEYASRMAGWARAAERDRDAGTTALVAALRDFYNRCGNATAGELARVLDEHGLEIEGVNR